MTTSLVSGRFFATGRVYGAEEDREGSLLAGFKLSDLQPSLTRILISIIYTALYAKLQKLYVVRKENYRVRN